MHRFIGLIFALLAIGMVAGCGKKEEATVATQVAAKVNADEITVHQVNNVLARSQNITPEIAAQAKREILNRLVEQQLARQQAIEKKLDRAPNVMQAIEAARSEILARAYLEQIAAAQPKPTAEEAKKYYAEHPELFAQRRIFNLEEIVIQPQEGLAAGLREQAAKARSTQDIAAWLKSQDAKFAANRWVRPAEQVPLELLSKLQAMKNGEIRLIETRDHLNLLRVVESKAAPVDEATATPRIQQFLFTQRSREVVAREIKQLKEKANIVYVGEFAKEAGASETGPVPPSAAPAATTEPPPQEPLAPNIEKGVRGLR